MTTFPGSPRLMKGGLVLIDPQSGHVLRMIALQYNPDTLTRTLQPQAVGSEGGQDRSQALRLTAGVPRFQPDQGQPQGPVMPIGGRSYL